MYRNTIEIIGWLGDPSVTVDKYYIRNENFNCDSNSLSKSGAWQRPHIYSYC